MIATTRGYLIIPFFFVVSLLVGCSTAGEDEMKKRQMEVRTELENSITETEAAISRLEKDIDAASEDVKEGLEAKLDRLEATRDELRDALDKVGGTTADEWDEFQKSVRRTVDNAKQTLREV
jgi:uncharacterized protein YPO0396